MPRIEDIDLGESNPAKAATNPFLVGAVALVIGAIITFFFFADYDMEPWVEQNIRNEEQATCNKEIFDLKYEYKAEINELSSTLDEKIQRNKEIRQDVKDCDSRNREAIRLYEDLNKNISAQITDLNISISEQLDQLTIDLNKMIEDVNCN